MDSTNLSSRIGFSSIANRYKNNHGFLDSENGLSRCQRYKELHILAYYSSTGSDLKMLKLRRACKVLKELKLT